MKSSLMDYSATTLYVVHCTVLMMTCVGRKKFCKDKITVVVVGPL